MAETKTKRPSFTTPKGTFKWPRFNEADTKFKAEGEFSGKLILPAADAKVLSDKLMPLWKEAIKEGKAAYAALPVATRKKLDAKGGFTANPLSTPVYDDSEQETGEVEFNFKMTASGVSKKTNKPWSRKPALFDAKMVPLPKGVTVWGGSEGKVSFEPSAYFIPGTGAAGLKLNLNAVQITKLVSGGERSGEAYGFEAEEGFEASSVPADADLADTTDEGKDAASAEDQEDF